MMTWIIEDSRFHAWRWSSRCDLLFFMSWPHVIKDSYTAKYSFLGAYGIYSILTSWHPYGHDVKTDFKETIYIDYYIDSEDNTRDLEDRF